MFLKISISAFFFLIMLINFSVKWLSKTFGNITTEQLLFHLTFPLGDTDPQIIIIALRKILLPSIGLTIVFVFLFVLSKEFLRSFFSYLFKRFLKYRIYLGILSVLVAIVGVYTYVNKKINIVSYVESQRNKVYSSFYEDYYVAPNSQNIIFPLQKRNLILIYLESMESTFANYNGKNLIPNLHSIANENIFFSDSNSFGGTTQTTGATFTIGGIVAYGCGVNLRMPIDGNGFVNKNFLSNIRCLGDILDENGYEQTIIMGGYKLVSGIGNLFEVHKIGVRDIDYFKDSGLLAKNYRLNWGMEDKKTFAFAKQYLTNYDSSQPFALRIISIDTHAPGFVDEGCDRFYGHTYMDSVVCQDKMLGEFLQWVSEQEFYKDTTIVVLGDHLTMQSGLFSQDVDRKIYNAFINAKFTREVDLSRTKNRQFAHYDMFPTILDSLNVKIVGDRLGLGTSLFGNKQTIMEAIGVSKFNNLLGQDNKIYEGFWRVSK